MPDYVSDPRVAKLPFMKLKNFLADFDNVDEEVRTERLSCLPTCVPSCSASASSPLSYWSHA